MTRPQQQFLELLRAGLWDKPADQELEQHALHRHFTINGSDLELHQKSTSSANRKQRRLIDTWTYPAILCQSS